VEERLLLDRVNSYRGDLSVVQSVNGAIYVLTDAAEAEMVGQDAAFPEADMAAHH
jgi:hypothetical protein